MKIAIFFGTLLCAMLLGCAGERQGMVCEEMEYRLNTMAYSPDQRAYAEEELRVCREEEAVKKAEGAAARQSIYDRFAANDTTGASNGTDGSVREVSVSKALKDSSGKETVSIYDRYEGKADTAASDVSNFQ